MGDLTNNFSRNEFACNCGCGYDGISLDLVERLQQLRDYILHNHYKELPLTIRSGCRCLAHNKSVGGVKHSAHLTGEAVDIKCYASHERALILTAAIKMGFHRIGLGRTFIHLDISETLPGWVAWYY
jgi:uncharacterized protein YcbK (DUF882 family)